VKARRIDMRLLVVAIAVIGVGSGLGARAVADGAGGGSHASLSGTIRHSYATLPELARAADTIIVGQVRDQASLTYGRLPFTKSEVTVVQTLKGGDIGAVLSVLETGGVFHPAARDGSPVHAGTQIVDFEGVPVMSTGGSYVLFLRSYTGDITDRAYVVLGEFQGKFPVADGRVHFAGTRSRLAEPTFAVLNAADGASLPAFLQMIGNALR
jgi:hypothetical protein